MSLSNHYMRYQSLKRDPFPHIVLQIEPFSVLMLVYQSLTLSHGLIQPSIRTYYRKPQAIVLESSPTQPPLFVAFSTLNGKNGLHL